MQGTFFFISLMLFGDNKARKLSKCYFMSLCITKTTTKGKYHFFKVVNWLLNIFLKFTEVSKRDRNKINSDP